jgi:tellurite resistance protein
MIELTYKSIQSYIVEEEQRGEMMYCKFSVEEQEFETEVAIERVGESKGLGLMVKNPNKMRSMLLRALNKGIRKKQVQEEDVPHVYFSKKELEAAAVLAFESILDEIVYIETTDKWHLATQFSDFEVFIRQNPLKENYDKKIMSRMLVEMARADGRIEEEERLFFSHFLNDEMGKLSDLITAPYLTKADCNKVSKNGRLTIFVIVSAVALTDNELEVEEQDKLNRFAEIFGLKAQKQQELFQIAQNYTLEIMLKVEAKSLELEELHAFADKIAMDRTHAEQVQAKFRAY